MARLSGVRAPSEPFPFHVVAKPIGPRCNLDCTYCYYLEKERLYPQERKFRMEDAVLERFIRDYIASRDAAGASEIWFTWQGGEPTLLGIEYFARIVALQEKHRPARKAVRNAIQTNGTLLTEEWARFLRRHGFLVGLSIDGPPPVHDGNRRDRRGGPTSGRVAAALDLLRAHRVEFNALTVVSSANVHHPLEVYRFLRDHGVAFMQFIPVVERIDAEGRLAGPPQGIADDSALRLAPWSVRPEDYGEFLCVVFDEWVRRDVGRVFVQFFELQLGLWAGAPSTLCVFAETCGQGPALEHNGDLYACDHYVYPEYRLGNIMEQPVGLLAASPAQRRFGDDKRESLPRCCRECRYRFACNGGCPKHRFLPAPGGGGEAKLNYFCASNRRFFGHAGPVLEVMAQLVRRRIPAGAIMRVLADAERRRAGRNDSCPCGSGRKFKRCCGATVARRGS
ncbi:MAG: anaerobic sulfatase maturase [Pseudomonadota bacterium]